MDLTKKTTCKQCSANTEVVLVRTITGSGVSQVYWKCSACGKNAGGSAQYIKHEKITTYGLEITSILIEKDYRQEKCQVCGTLGAEYHHWAPRHLFGDAADKWPTGWLCKKCHDEWHNKVTPNMCKR